MRNLVALLACGGLLSLTVGCAQSNVVRAQTPCQSCDNHGGGGMHGGGMHGMGMQGTGMQGMPPGMGMMGGHVAGPGPHYYDGPAGGSCPPGQGEIWRPTHHHTFEYKAPTDLRYPDPNQPPGIVQYPYYTVKGPTDFFFK